MSKPVDLDKLRSVRFGGATRGKARVKRLADPESGRTTGYEIDHGDTQAAVVRPQTIHASTSLSTGEIRVG